MQENPKGPGRDIRKTVRGGHLRVCSAKLSWDIILSRIVGFRIVMKDKNAKI